MRHGSVLADVETEHTFKLADGREIRNLAELSAAFSGMADHVFAHHVNGQKNDFANWVGAVIGDSELALSLRDASDAASAADIVGSRVSYHSTALFELVSDFVLANYPPHPRHEYNRSLSFATRLNYSEVSDMVDLVDICSRLNMSAPVEEPEEPDSVQAINDAREELAKILDRQSEKDPVTYYNNLLKTAPSPEGFLGRLGKRLSLLFK